MSGRARRAMVIPVRRPAGLVVVVVVVLLAASGCVVDGLWSESPPEDRFTVTPDPCELVSPAMVRDLVGNLSPERAEPLLEVPDSETRKCEWLHAIDDDEEEKGLLWIDVNRYESVDDVAGEARARRLYEELAYPCREEFSYGGAEACLNDLDVTMPFYVLQDNVRVRVALGSVALLDDEWPFPWSEELTFERLAREVIDRLAEAE